MDRGGVLEGQVAVVTGGSRGIGRAMAESLLGAGAAVAVTARNEQQVREAASELLESVGGRVIAVVGDVTSEADTVRMVAEVEDQLGPIDVLVNNAGASGPVGPAWQVDPDEWWGAIETNLKGPFLCNRAVLPSMVERGQGRIITSPVGGIC